MLMSQLESHIHKLLVKEWHGLRLEPANTSRDKIEGFAQMRRRMAGFVAGGNTEPCFVTRSYRKVGNCQKSSFKEIYRSLSTSRLPYP
jgi:hypothetical protein